MTADPIHNAGCIDWCNHCSECGDGILYGSLCIPHYNVHGHRWDETCSICVMGEPWREQASIHVDTSLEEKK